MGESLSAFDSWIVDINDANIIDGKKFDLTKKPYHGGSTLSSGVLPKWDELNGRYLIKRCSINAFGAHLTDAANEELVYLFCKEIGVNCAYYRLVQIKYFDTESNAAIECPAVVTKIFPGQLQHYKTIRSLCDLGQINDQMLDFAEKFEIQPALNDLLLVDYLFNQQDRHAKNLGVVNANMSPIFDSGACLFYDVFDNLLSKELLSEVASQKTFGKKIDDVLKFAYTYVHAGFSFEFNETLLISALEKALQIMAHAYSSQRFDFIEYFVKERINNVRKILPKA